MVQSEIPYDQEWFSLKEAAGILEDSTETLSRLIRSEQMRATKHKSGRWLVHREAIQERKEFLKRWGGRG